MRRWLSLALTLAAAPWPQMRLDSHNTARSPVPEVVRAGAQPWRVVTGKGVFNTPVIDARGTSYIGSADGRVYAIGRRGKVRWTFRTGGIIDAGGLLMDDGSLVVGSGDETLYRLRTRRRAPARVIWRFRTPTKPATGQLVNWWEGPLSRTPDGDILAGNTGGGAHRIAPDGTLRWVRQAGNSVWTAPATGDDGTTFWGSVDLTFFALDPAGQVKWSTPTLGFVTASPAIGADGTVYSASFDGKVYALDPGTGAPKWTYQTRDHVYGGPALAQDGLVVVGSTDGALYGLTPAGALKWRYDTGDPIRSSPAIGVTADGREVAYVGSSNGRLYAIDVATGRRRWSFDTTPADDPVLRDRNDLNGSPGLGTDRVVIAGEHGAVWGIPYDYCLTAQDPRCSTDPADDLPAEATRVAYVSPGGNTTEPGEVPPATVITGRLIVRRGGDTVDASALKATVEAGFPATTQTSGDGAFLFTVPDGFLEPSAEYAVRLSGPYTAGGVTLGNTVVGGTQAGTFDDTIRFRTAPLRRGPRLRPGDALTLTRLAVPLPPLLPSVNQIGFDSYDLQASVVSSSAPDARGERRVVLWVTDGVIGDFAFPLAGRVLGDQFILRRDGVTLRFSFGDVPLRRFELRGALTRRGRSRPGTALYGEVTCVDVPNYGPALYLTGICNPSGTLVAGGTFLFRHHAPVRVPRRIHLVDLAGDPTVTAVISGRLRARRHRVHILLRDADTREPVGIEYLENTTQTVRDGVLRGASLRVPDGTELPPHTEAVVLLDGGVVDARPLP